MKKQTSLLLLFCLLFPIFLQAAEESTTYPTPNRLFYVERSKNRNLVCYDINLNSSGTWNTSDPVVVYWINREETPGKREDLNAIQKRLAFGYKTISNNSSSAVIALNACSGRPIRVVKQNNGYICYAKINNQDVQLKKIYVKTKTPNSLTVEYVELYGRNAKGEEFSERILPS